MHRRSSARRLVLAALLVTAACGGDADVEAGQDGPVPAEEPTESTTTTVPARDPSLADVGLDLDPACDPPWPPVHAVAGTYGGEPIVVGEPPPDDGSIDVLGQRFTAPDTDGDGRPDEVGGEGERLVVRRGDGEVVLARDQGVVGSPGGQTWIGDLDGDGRDEIVAYATGSVDRAALEVYLVPGTVQPGEHDPGEVGVLVPWQPNSLLWSVGDHDGDGADDAVVAVPGGGAAIVSGPDLLAPGAGGTLDDVPPTLRPAPDGFVGVLRLALDATPVFVTAEDVGGDDETRIELTVHTDPALRLRIGGLGPAGGGWGPTGTVSGFRSGDHRIVVYEFSGGRSGYGATWMWDLDDPCAGG